jgi:hypothetical protein
MKPESDASDSRYRVLKHNRLKFGSNARLPVFRSKHGRLFSWQANARTQPASSEAAGALFCSHSECFCSLTLLVVEAE